MSPTAPEPAPQIALGSRGLRANLKFAALVLVLLPLLVGLGFWQLSRAEEKSRTLALVEATRAGAPLPIGSFVASDGPALDGRRVELRGRYDAAHSFLLDNRVFRGRVGYELITPFRDESGATLMIDRGWLLAPPTRAELPRVDTPAGDVVLSGEFYVPRDLRRLALDPAAGWPLVVQALDVPGLGRLAGVEVFPHLVRLGAEQPGAYESDRTRVNMTPGRHVAYAVQWILMAAALLVVFALGGTNLREWWRNKRAGEAPGNVDD